MVELEGEGGAKSRFSADLEAVDRTICCQVGTCVTRTSNLTLAMSSLFLNSPLTNVTFPFSSNSVQRSRGSLDAFSTRRGVDPSRKLARGGSFFVLDPSPRRNHFHHEFMLVVVKLLVAAVCTRAGLRTTAEGVDKQLDGGCERWFGLPHSRPVAKARCLGIAEIGCAFLDPQVDVHRVGGEA